MEAKPGRLGHGRVIDQYGYGAVMGFVLGLADMGIFRNHTFLRPDGGKQIPVYDMEGFLRAIRSVDQHALKGKIHK